MNVVFIGGGQMGSALLKAALDKKVLLPENIFLLEKDKNRREALLAEYGIKGSDK